MVLNDFPPFAVASEQDDGTTFASTCYQCVRLLAYMGGKRLPNLSVRKIDDEVYELLRIRAARNGVSMEEEVRRILKRAVSAPERLGDLALEYFGDDGVELELPPREPHEPMSVGE